nr:MAG: hypothetical protein DIU67_05630 [Actinomycetota bacterium]
MRPAPWRPRPPARGSRRGPARCTPRTRRRSPLARTRASPSPPRRPAAWRPPGRRRRRRRSPRA